MAPTSNVIVKHLCPDLLDVSH